MKKGKWLQSFLVPEGKLRDAMELYPGKSREEVREILFREIGKRLLPGAILAVFFLVLAMLSGGDAVKEEGILRPAPGKAAVFAEIQLELESGRKTLSLPIGSLEYEESRIEELQQEAERYLAEVVPGENEGFAKVTKDLYFPTAFPATGGEIYWTTDAPWVITSEGAVLNGDLTAPEQVKITAELFYGSESRFYSELVSVYPAEYKGEEAILREVQKELVKQEEASRTAERFLLPESVQGYRVEEAETEKFRGGAFLILLAVVIPMLLYYGYFGSLDTRRKERKELAEGCYTDFITKLSLLLAAGISVRQGFVRLEEEYAKNHGAKHVLAAELKVTKQELENGRSESVVYEEFGRRIGVLAYRRMASLLTQNVSKGVQGIRMLLLQEAKEVMAQDRANIRQRGEQAGTKLLLPMMGLLLLVFAILLVPAFQSF